MTSGARPADLCVAFATPPGVSALAVVRVSGSGCASQIEPCFRPAGKRFPPVSQLPGYACAVGDFIDPTDQTLIDRVVLTRFIAPDSFTGEDSIEISCHGGTAVKRQILDVLIGLGCRPAEPGEFSRRAFLNGKLDLAEAEAIMDLIAADAQAAAREAARQLKGGLAERIGAERGALTRLLAQLELVLEFPEHEDAAAAARELAELADQSAQSQERLLATYRQGRLLREGLQVVFAGLPNAGKSSLLNALAGTDRAIVTDRPGTTRDRIDVAISLAGLPVLLTDTAGLRQANDPAEQIGTERARQAADQADLVFWLWAADDAVWPGDQAEFQRLRTHPGLRLLIAKADLPQAESHLREARAKTIDLRPLAVSARTGCGLDALTAAIVDFYQSQGSGSEQVLLTNARHRDCLQRAAQSTRQAADGLQSGLLPLDVAAAIFRQALDALAELTGEQVSEALIETIFSRFCVGK